MRVDSLCTRMGFDSEKSLDDPSLFLDLARLKDDLDMEKKLRQKMADRVVDLEKLLTAEKKKTAELRFIRQNDNEEIIRLEKQVQSLVEKIFVRSACFIDCRFWKKIKLSYNKNTKMKT